MLRTIFMGTPDFAVPTLEALLKHHTVVGVATQPDRPAGRRGELKAPPVKVLAVQAGIPVIQPEKLRQPGVFDQLEAWQADLIVVAAFGQILPERVLNLPRYGCLNVHASLLPRWRGAAPIQAALRAGDAETGITIMRMDAGLDTGPMLRKRAIAISDQDTSASLHDTLAMLGADLLIETIPGYISGEIKPITQDETEVTYAPQIRKEDGRIDWNEPAEAIERSIRAFTPWPGVFTIWNGKVLKIHRARISAGHARTSEVIATPTGFAVGTSTDLIVPEELQLEGKKRVEAAEFVRGYPAIVGAMLNNG